jgi:hypothetical protein
LSWPANASDGSRRSPQKRTTISSSRSERSLRAEVRLRPCQKRCLRNLDTFTNFGRAEPQHQRPREGARAQVPALQ